MYNDIHKQNSFSRSLANEEKMGAYYTDLGMCARVHTLFQFPETEECCVLEPSIGDGSAVLTVTGKTAAESNIKIFGVELNRETAAVIQENPLINYSINADFLNGIKVSHNSFSFCFANPPYGRHQDNGKRYEYLFAEKLWYYLNGRGILCLVIPYYVLTDESFLKGFFARFQPFATFRFDEGVYEQFKQVVVIAEKRSSIGYLRQYYDDYCQTIDALEKLPLLPTEAPEKRIKVSPSCAANMEYFTTLAFDAEKASENIRHSSLYDLMASKIFIPSFAATELGHPPMPLKKDLLYLTATAGGGQGLVGSEENHDLHLQRGVAKVVKVTETVTDGAPRIVERQFTRIVLNTVEADGRITTLE